MDNKQTPLEDRISGRLLLLLLVQFPRGESLISDLNTIYHLPLLEIYLCFTKGYRCLVARPRVGAVIGL